MPKAVSYHPLPLAGLSNLAERSSPLLLLDSAARTKTAKSYLFVDPVRVITARTYGEIPSLFKELDASLSTYSVAGYLAYESAYALEEKLAAHQAALKPALPLAWFGVFEKPYIFDHATGRWDRSLPIVGESILAGEAPQPGRVMRKICRKDFGKDIARIKRLIARGDTYQVNYTYDVSYRNAAAPFEVYQHIRRNQPAPYCAYLQCEFGHVLSFSPELFFEKRGGAIRVKPMKGTASRGRWGREDREIIRFLGSDEKNRAENVMIVDLLRNDLGRMCRFGSVKTTKLFEVETHPTVHQMTSTVVGKIERGVRLSKILSNLFPCGSVTGAPKIRTMEIILDLEQGTRGVYTGALGFASPGGDAKFSVPIRTLQRPVSSTTWKYRVGAGIVWDSKAQAEWEECEHKTAFLTHTRPRFELLETMLYDRRLVYKREHLARMKLSAEYFGVPFERNALSAALGGISRECERGSRFRVRLLLDEDGRFRWEMHPLAAEGGPTTDALLVSRTRLNERDPFVYHKTTHRPWYLSAMKMAREGKCYDVVFLNSKGHVAEASMNNVFVEKGGELMTPPLSSGLLPGVLRQRLLAAGRCVERNLRLRDLHFADAIYCGNSVRGLVKVQLRG